VKPARGTEVAIVGIRASCQPIPVLIIEAPAPSIACASWTISCIRGGSWGKGEGENLMGKGREGKKGGFVVSVNTN